MEGKQLPSCQDGVRDMDVEDGVRDMDVARHSAQHHHGHGQHHAQHHHRIHCHGPTFGYPELL